MFASNTSQVSSDAVFIEDTFSTTLYTGNGSTQTINNGIDLAGKGGLVWTKARSAANRHALVDTVRGGAWELASNLTDGQNAISPATTFGAAGYTMNDSATSFNSNGVTYASWTFREAPKFFDVVTYTGNGALATRYISHSLGSVPGCIMVKRTDTASDWVVIHRSTTFPLILNSTAAASSTNRNNGYPDLSYTDATQFAVSDGASGVSAVNASGGTYVAYLFAHNAGGFGLTGTDNVISCGITDGSKVTLGWEPQWILHKASNFSSNWDVLDTMRGMPWGQQARMLNPNLANAEAASSDTVNGQPYSPKLYADGFELGTIVGNHIYIAIRRGPMKVPTDGTKVFNADFYRSASAVSNNVQYYSGWPVDTAINMYRPGGVNRNTRSRLTGANYLAMNTTDAEVSGSADFFGTNQGYIPATSGSNDTNIEQYLFRRAPGFFDEVCYKGTSSVQNVTHNLTVAPEIIIVKKRDSALTSDWFVYSAPLGNGQRLRINSSSGSASTTAWNSTNPSATQWTMDGSSQVNETGYNFVAYLFASCPGVSKVGSYTGNGSSQTINCGFTGGARFVLIKRTDSTGDWYVWDTARGIVSANDPRLSLNTTAAEVTTDDSIDPNNSGFIVNQVSATNINVSSATYIYLAIA